MASYQKTANINGSAISHLKAVKQVDNASGLVPKALTKAPAQQQKLVDAVMQVVLTAIHDSDQNQLMLDSKLADVILMRIASLLEVFKKSLVDEDLQAAKDEIISKIEDLSEGFISKLIKEYLAKQLVNLFDEPATKDDIEELKEYLMQVAEATKLNGESQQDKSSIGAQGEEKANQAKEESVPTVYEEKEDKEEGSYLDSTPAKNFFTLQTYIGQQFEQLNATIAKMTTPRMTPSAARKSNKLMKMFGKVTDVVQKVFGYLKKVIDPAIEFITSLIKKFVVIPIMVIALKVALVIAAITLIVVGIVLAVKWVKDKLVQFWNYIVSGEMWEDIKAGLLAAWEWLKDFGKFLWDITLDALKYIFVGMWVDLGKWFWKQMTNFWNWCYNKFIGPYIVKPVKKAWNYLKGLWTKTIYPKIKPFVESAKALINKLRNLGGAIKKAILDWWNGDSSLMDTIKNIGGMLGNAISEWWSSSPFKLFYEKYLYPFVASAGELFKRLKNLGEFIKQAILDWWNGDSSLGDTLKNIGTTVWNTVKEWWARSIFKKYWDKAMVWLDDLLQPLRDWWNESWLGRTFQQAWTSLKEKWDAFKKAWDNFSFVDTMTTWWEQSTLKSWIDTIKGWLDTVVNAVTNFATTIKDGLVSWYEESSVKQWIDKVKDFGKSIGEGLQNWYAQSSLKLMIDKIRELLDVYVIAPIRGIKRKIASFILKLSDEFVIKIPLMNFNDSIKPWNWSIDWEVFHPFNFATKNWTPEQKNQAREDADKSATNLIKEEMTKMEELIEKSRPQVVQNFEEISQTTIQNSQEIAQQVVNQQMQPLQEMEQTKTEQNSQVNESFASVAKARELEQQKQQEQQSWRDNQSYEMFQFMKDMRSEMKDGFANPNVIPAPIMITNNAGPNPAMMENR